MIVQWKKVRKCANYVIYPLAAAYKMKIQTFFSVVPAEGNKPLPLFSDELFEELVNPDKFPNGSGGFTSTHRMTRLTLGKYVNACLLDQNSRFAKYIEYIFAMQYAVEHK